MPFKNLNDDNFVLFAMKCYDKPNCVMSEFQEDIKRFNYIKRLFQRYRRHKEIRERLILNHLIIIYNVFGIEASTRMLFFVLDEEDHSALKAFLMFLNYMPNVIKGVEGRDIFSLNIIEDFAVIEKLKESTKYADH